uniref:Uncharacterized protein n=1 Tax=Fagus sylvatica TaxID=28930 RepID=A0A2N9II94_FAGSY
MAEAIPFGLVRKIIESCTPRCRGEAGHEQSSQDWLMKLRDVAYDADDVLSDFSTEDLRRRVMYGDKMAKKLTSLQTLPLFVVSKDLKASSSKHCGGLAELNKLNNLRGELCIKNLAWVTDATLEAKAANLKEKRHLRSLELSWDSEDNNDTYVSDDENLLEGLQPYHTLKKLNVEGYRGMVEGGTSWMRQTTTSISSDQYQQHISLPSFPCLSNLDIRNCNNLTCMPLFPYLEESLYLWNTSFKPLQETMAMTMNMSATSSLPSSSSSSPPLSKLKSLTLFGIQDVESLPEELLKNLTSLQRLDISNCPNLTSLPEGIGNLTSLQSLNEGIIFRLPIATSDLTS